MTTHPDGSPRPVGRVIGGIVFAASIIGLYFQFTEPFMGSRLAYAGRLLGPFTVMLTGLHLLWQPRKTTLVPVVVVVLGVMTLLFVLAGLGR